jgi:alkylation response protein AidB-like acyl-CoA dehydrogenase
VITFLSSAQEAIIEKYMTFAAESVAPLVKGLETHSVCLKDFMQNLGQKGYLGISVPREYGGQGNAFVFAALFVEAVSSHEPGLGLSLSNHYALIEVIKKYGSETQKSRYLPLLSRGELLGTLAFSEETAGTDYRAVMSTLQRSADAFILNGKKTWVVNGELSGLALVLSKNVEGESNALAVSLVDCSAKEQVHCSSDRGRLGLRSAYVNNVDFADCKVSAENLIDAKFKVEEVATYAMDVAKTILAAAAVGLTSGALNAAVEHARKRQQFGTNIGQFQGVQWKLADASTELEGARLQVLRAGWSLDGEPEKFSTYAAMCKWFASRAARIHSGEALQVMGAIGLSDECPLEKFYRDAKAMEICMGTSEAQKLQLVDALEI